MLNTCRELGQTRDKGSCWGRSPWIPWWESTRTEVQYLSCYANVPKKEGGMFDILIRFTLKTWTCLKMESSATKVWFGQSKKSYIVRGNLLWFSATNFCVFFRNSFPKLCGKVTLFRKYSKKIVLLLPLSSVSGGWLQQLLVQQNNSFTACGQRRGGLWARKWFPGRKESICCFPLIWTSECHAWQFFFSIFQVLVGGLFFPDPEY